MLDTPIAWNASARFALQIYKPNPNPATLRSNLPLSAPPNLNHLIHVVREPVDEAAESGGDDGGGVTFGTKGGYVNRGAEDDAVVPAACVA